jgi:hypothetical protein
VFTKSSENYPSYAKENSQTKRTGLRLAFGFFRQINDCHFEYSLLQYVKLQRHREDWSRMVKGDTQNREAFQKVAFPNGALKLFRAAITSGRSDLELRSLSISHLRCIAT